MGDGYIFDQSLFEGMMGRIVADFNFLIVLSHSFILHAFALAPHSLSHSDMITPSLALDAAEIGYDDMTPYNRSLQVFRVMEGLHCGFSAVK